MPYTEEKCKTNRQFAEMVQELQNEIVYLRPYLQKLQDGHLMAESAESQARERETSIDAICEKELRTKREKLPDGGNAVDAFRLADEKLQCQLKLWLRQ